MGFLWLSPDVLAMNIQCLPAVLLWIRLDLSSFPLALLSMPIHQHARFTLKWIVAPCWVCVALLDGWMYEWILAIPFKVGGSLHHLAS